MTRTMLDFPDPRTIDTPAPPGVDPHAARVLVVDDDPANRESLARRLTRRGIAVDTAEDGLAAMHAIEAAETDDRPFDLVLLDVMMPGLSGLEVLAKVRQTRPATMLPIIMATANDASEDIVAALNAGANDYVTKPLDFNVVFARVQTQLELRQSVRQIIELERRLVQRNEELEHANRELRRSAEQTRRDLVMAAKVQASFLPRDSTLADEAGDHVRFAWRYDPCSHVAGDALNICQLDEEHVGIYILDVSGHGVAAALTAVNAARLMAPAHDPDTILVDTADDGTRRIVPPAEVAARLSQRFRFNADTIQFVTCFYAVMNIRTLHVDYVSAGHPPPLLIRGDCRPTTLDATGMPVGIGTTYEQRSTQLQAGDRLLLYTDGVSECRQGGNGEEFGLQRLTDLLCTPEALALSIDAAIDRVRLTLADWREGKTATDDVSLLALECA